MTTRRAVTHSTIIFVLALLSLLPAAVNAQPWNNPLMMATSTDGITFSTPRLFQDSGNVVSAIRWHGDTLVSAFQWGRGPAGSPTWDRVAIKYSYDSGNNWTQPQLAVFNNFPATYQRPFDPTLVLTPSDSIRIYFSSSAVMGADSTINTYSAISRDGLNFYFEPNARVDHPTSRVIDPAVICFNNLWHYTSPIGAPNQGAYHYISNNGINFTQVANIPSDPNHNWLGNFVINSNTELRFYGSGFPYIWYNSSANGGVWNGYVSTNIPGADPTIVRKIDSTYIAIFTGPPYTSVSERQMNPKSLQLEQNYPNPFNASTAIRFTLPRSGTVNLKLFDVNGKEIATILQGSFNSGTHSAEFTSHGLVSGLYVYRLIANGHSISRKLIVIK